MASLSKRRDGGFAVQFYRECGKRETISLGAAPQEFAEEFRLRVGAIVRAEKYQTPHDPATRAWLDALAAKWKGKLARVGLVESVGATSVGGLCEFCLERARKKKDLAPSTLIKYEEAAESLLAFFSPDRQLASIAEDAAEEFQRWLHESGGRRNEGGPLAPATATIRCKQAKTFFGDAVKRGWLRSNPFDGLSWSSGVNTDRQRYIDRDDVRKVMEHADASTRLLLALARFAGLRVPSEAGPLTWSYVDWERGTLTVYSQKTKRYEGKACRQVPISPELRDELLRAKQPGTSEAALLGDWSAVSAAALRNRLERSCNRAKTRLWVKPWQNLRASRETDWLSDGHPIHVVTTWMGNSPKIALKHYAQVTPDQVQKATGAAPSSVEATEPTRPRKKRRSRYRKAMLFAIATWESDGDPTADEVVKRFRKKHRSGPHPDSGDHLRKQFENLGWSIKRVKEDPDGARELIG